MISFTLAIKQINIWLTVTVDLELDHQRLYSPLPMLMVYQENPKRQSQETQGVQGFYLNKT